MFAPGPLAPFYEGVSSGGVELEINSKKRVSSLDIYSLYYYNLTQMFVYFVNWKLAFYVC